MHARVWFASRRRCLLTGFGRPLFLSGLVNGIHVSRICDDGKPEQRSCKTLPPAAPATPAPQCSGSGQRGCFVRSTRGTLRTGPAPSQHRERPTTRCLSASQLNVSTIYSRLSSSRSIHLRLPVLIPRGSSFQRLVEPALENEDSERENCQGK